MEEKKKSFSLLYFSKEEKEKKITKENCERKRARLHSFNLQQYKNYKIIKMKNLKKKW